MSKLLTLSPSLLMPLDIALSTNTPTGTLALQQAQSLGDAVHLAAFLVVRSGGFAAAVPFVFTRDALTTFAEALGDEREARLTNREGNGWIDVACRGEADTQVSGELIDEGQLMRFRFSTRSEGVTQLRDGASALLYA